MWGSKRIADCKAAKAKTKNSKKRIRSKKHGNHPLVAQFVKAHEGCQPSERATAYRPILFNELVLSDKLYEHCAEINEAARNRMELIVPELAKRNGVTEKLKAENQMEWVRQMNACKAQAEAIVKFELIYDWYRDRPDQIYLGGHILTVDFFMIFWYNLSKNVRDKSRFIGG